MKLSVFWFAIAMSLTALPVWAAERVVLITLDGVRCQEMFQGMDRSVWQAQNEGKAIEETELYKLYWAETPEERRRKLMPFFWEVLMKNHGAIVGNRFKGSVMKVTNRHRFSYPGYSEILTGTANDLVIKSNDKLQNPKPTILDYLREELRLPREQVAAFASWEVFNWIVTSQAGSIVSNAGFQAYDHTDPAIRELSDLQFHTPTPWNSVRHDRYTFRFAMAHLKTHRPKVVYLALGETDDWAHDKRYDRVLETLHRNDGYFRELWEWLQSQEDYRGKTALYFTTDHGRGDDALNWMHHNDKLDGAAFVWLAAAGVGIQARGELASAAELSQNQIASTLAASMGLDFRSAHPDAGVAIELFK